MCHNFNNIISFLRGFIYRHFIYVPHIKTYFKQFHLPKNVVFAQFMSIKASDQVYA
jgi:hypothetical protein